MVKPLKLSKVDARRAYVRHHFAQSANLDHAFERLRTVQFDPIAPVGCNHDLVLQARVPGYRVGDWETYAYTDRKVYDGWDKQASLVPYEHYPLRRIFHGYHDSMVDRIRMAYPHAIDRVLAELRERGPLLPREFEFQQRHDAWEGSWYGPNVTKQVLRALWNTGQVMTAGRKNGHHIYDLAERVLPEHLRALPPLDMSVAKLELAMERYRAMGLLRPLSGPEVWSYSVLHYDKRPLSSELEASGRIVPIDVEGVKAYATPEFLALLDQPSIDPRVVFIAPLDQFMWDRKMIQHLFSFDYTWEIYTPEHKRKWGYYVLPVLFGDALVARIEFFCRGGVLEVRAWHVESQGLPTGFKPAFRAAMTDFKRYCGASTVENLPI